MPLSEHEQRVLEQLERQLSSDDPKLATTLRAPRRRSLRRIVIALSGIAVGLVLLIVGVSNGVSLLGVLGFAVMFAAVTFAFSAPKNLGPQGVVGGTTPRGRAPRKQGFMKGLEDRWDRRRDERDR